MHVKPIDMASVPLSGLLSLLLLAAASRKIMKSRGAHLPAREEVMLSANSPKRDYIEEITVELVQRPLMEPVTGKIVYDETHTVRVSSPIAGRVIGAIAAMGRLFAQVMCWLNWIARNWGRRNQLIQTLSPI